MFFLCIHTTSFVIMKLKGILLPFQLYPQTPFIMINKNRKILILLSFLFCLRSFAQNGTQQPDSTKTPYPDSLNSILAVTGGGTGYMPSIIPPSPNMSSLGKFIEHPVNNYTGVPKIAIPIYTIKHRDLEVPLQINYHASGNKVETMASWIGLGWSLNAGGSVTRSVRGLPDDLYSITTNITGGPSSSHCLTYNNAGYLYSANDVEIMYSEANTDTTRFLNNLREIGMGAKDGIPDMFYFSFGKYSGNFVFDELGNINLIPKQDLKITIQRPTDREITGFTITTPDGIRYVFSEVEKSIITSTGASSPLTGNGGIESKLNFQGPFFGISGSGDEEFVFCGTDESRVTYNSSWQLTKIISPRSGEEITFSYREEKNHVQSYSNETLFWWNKTNNSTAFRTKNAVSNYTKTKVIESIVWPTGYAQFKIDLAQPRLDTDRQYQYKPHAGNETIFNYALDKIEIYETDSTKVKTVDFTYSYFQSTDIPSFTDGSGTDYTYYKNAVAKRLRLERMTESGTNPYLFNYSTETLPNRSSTEQDFWGFYKPNSSNSLIPIIYEYPNETVSSTSFHTSSFSIYPRQTYVGTQTLHSNSAWDRSTDTTAMKAGVLTEIIYPTKGGTLFTYSPNEFYIDGQKIIGGGLRIRQIRISKSATYTDADDIIENYSYHDSGKIVDLPVFGAYGSKGDGGVIFHGNWSGGLALTQGSYVGYGQVSKTTAGNGKTVFKYQTPAMYGTISEDIYSRPLIEKKYLTLSPLYGGGVSPCTPWLTSTLKLDYYPRPISPNYEWGRGLLDEMEIWDQNGNLIKKTKNNYTVKSHKKIKNIQVAVVHVDSYAAEELGTNRCWAGRHCYNFTRTYDISPWIILDKTTEYFYNGGSTPVTQIKDFTYGSTSHRQITQKRVTQSDGSILETNFSYPYDYQSVSGRAAFIPKMLDQYIINVPVETVTYIEKAPSDRKIIDASVTTFKSYTGSASKPELMLPYKTFRFNGYDGSIGSSFLSYPGTSEDAATSSYLEVIKYTNYDTKGNPLSLISNRTHQISYLWAYNGQFPVAEIKNADYSAVTTALTGAGTSYSVLSAMTNSSDIKTKTDAVRTTLSSAQVTGYQFFWLTGIHSITDPTNKTLYYERDSYGRLVTIHSGGGSIRASYCYNYAGMTTDCQAVSVSGVVTPASLALIPDEEVALPVTLVDFTVVKEGPSALLTWTTTSETNSESFEIEHSTDGKKWRKLERIPAKGESAGTINYGYKHAEPLEGENLYRLKIIDRDGTHAYSRIRSLVFGEGQEIIFYPNPISVGDKLYLQASDPQNINRISIFNNVGELLLETGYQTEINVSKLSAGLYIVQVIGSDGSVTKHKIVKR